MSRRRNFEVRYEESRSRRKFGGIPRSSLLIRKGARLAPDSSISGLTPKAQLAVKRIILVSLMADNASFFYERLAKYLTGRVGIGVHFVNEVDWRQRERMLAEGEAHIGFVCGLQYVQKRDELNADIQVLAAPVMRSSRYNDLPIYFSDVVVRRDSPFRWFEDLRDTAWAYNEPTSHSGCNLVRYYLAQRGETSNYFKRVAGSGAHQESLRMVLEREVDATAIDSTVLELEQKLRPEIAEDLRVIETLGPSPIPPAVISRRVPRFVRRSVRHALLDMHNRSEGRTILSAALLRRFARASDSDYDTIRFMAVRALSVSFQA